MNNETLAKVVVSMTKLVLYAVWNAAFACMGATYRDKKGLEKATRNNDTYLKELERFEEEIWGH